MKVLLLKVVIRVLGLVQGVKFRLGFAGRVQFMVVDKVRVSVRVRVSHGGLLGRLRRPKT